MEFSVGLSLLLAFALILSAVIQQIFGRRAEGKVAARVTEAESRISAEPDKTKPAWDLARVTLESYYNRNLSQVTAIFWLSVVVMFLGFIVILYGSLIAIQSRNNSLAAIISGGCGVITEFIGASFMILYRSIMQQANNYMQTLERINTVGMAMYIIDSIPAAAAGDNLKDQTKVELAKTLMQRIYTSDSMANPPPPAP